MSLLKRFSATYYADGVAAGNRTVLSRAISIIESTLPEDNLLAQSILALLPVAQESSFRLGITGVPGVGKSTFIEWFGLKLVAKGHKVAVLAIDPSSSISGGSILGDKTRMDFLSQHPSAYIRPSANGLALGGVAARTRETIRLVEAAGFNYIFVETVGVGQAETAVRNLTDFFLLLLLAGGGDQLQGVKRGIMEMADALVITKADADNVLPAKRARLEYLNALHLYARPSHGIMPDVLLASALEDQGFEPLFAVLKAFIERVTANGWLLSNRRHQQIDAFHDALQQAVLQQFYLRDDAIFQIAKAEASLEADAHVSAERPSVLVREMLQSLGLT